MDILIGCEESGTVRTEFEKRGHKVLSCDVQPTRQPGAHYEGDLFDVIDYPWDLAIFHPPCTHTAVSGARHFETKWLDGRQAAGVSFIHRIYRRAQHIPRFAIEQPITIVKLPLPSQVIQPWMFGHGETKATKLFLRNLPELQPTNVVAGRDDRIHKMPPSAERARERSVTYRGIAEAMAEQWSKAA